MTSLQKSLFRLAVATLFALFFLIIFGSNAGADFLMAFLDSHATPLTSPLDERAQAIVVLGGGSGREDYAAKLQRQTNLPLLISGVEAPVMKRELTNPLATPIRWIEGQSRTTEENAAFSALILKRNGIHHIMLVTNADHMWRAQTMFRQNGIDVISAPVPFPRDVASSRDRSLFPNDFVPSTESFMRSRSARHELIGLAWFWARSLVPVVTP